MTLFRRIGWGTIGLATAICVTIQKENDAAKFNENNDVNLSGSGEAVHFTQTNEQGIGARIPEGGRLTEANIESRTRDLVKRIRSGLRRGRSVESDHVFSSLLPELLQLDPLQAAHLAERLEPWAWREEVLRLVARELAKVNPLAAALWSTRLASEFERREVLTVVCLEISEWDPEQAIQLAQRYTREKRNLTLLENIVQNWAGKDFPAAVNWAGRQSPGVSRDKIFARLAYVRSLNTPAEAAQIVVRNISDNAIQEDAAIAVLHQWLLRNPGEAASWVELFPVGNLRQRAEDELVSFVRYQQVRPENG